MTVLCPNYGTALILAECVRARGGDTGAVFADNRLIVDLPK